VSAQRPRSTLFFNSGNTCHWWWPHSCRRPCSS